MNVPLVDISAFPHGDRATRLHIARELGQAFETSGFLTLSGYDIDEAVIDGAYRAVTAFFDTPLAVKQQYALPERGMNRGYLPIGIETVAQTLAAQSPPDLCEALVYRSLFQEERNAASGTGSAWRNFWPAEPAGLGDCVKRYYWAIDRLMDTLYEIAALALDLPETYFKPYFLDHHNTLRFVNYPDQPHEPLAGQLRYGAHHDYGGLTLVRQDAAPGGLQIASADGTWHDAPIVPRSFIVNIGDLMARWTNDRWRSTLHRVMNPSRSLTGSTRRLSMVVFSRPDDDAQIACLPTCVDAADRPRFPPVSAGDFTRAKLQQSATG
jgi:isopenicillin N synthase-like dioxygenase